MTIREMKTEITEMNLFAMKNMDVKMRSTILKRKDELLTSKGYKHLYVRKNARKDEVLAHLECFINAYYDCGQHEMLDQYYKERGLQ